MQNYCDIVPDATGWLYVIDGIRSPSYYHSYDLALNAACANLAKRNSFRPPILRRQGLNGAMHTIALSQERNVFRG